jgi:hypothetical protein
MCVPDLKVPACKSAAWEQGVTTSCLGLFLVLSAGKTTAMVRDSCWTRQGEVSTSLQKSGQELFGASNSHLKSIL